MVSLNRLSQLLHLLRQLGRVFLTVKATVKAYVDHSQTL